MGSLKEPFLVYSQPQNDGITVYRNKDLGEIRLMSKWGLSGSKELPDSASLMIYI